MDFLKYIGIILMFSLMSVVLGYGLASLLGGEMLASKAALIPVEAVISTADGQGIISSEWLVEKIEQAESDDSVSSLIFRINSAGGTAVACMEVIEAMENVSKPMVAWIREIAGSCAYMIAAKTDYVIAHEFSTVGGVGAISSYLQFPGLFEKYGIEYVRIASGEMKDAGSPYRNITEEEKRIFQEMVDSMHADIMEFIKENREIPEEELVNVSKGKLYLGKDAVEIGIIDGLGGKKEVHSYLEERLNVSKITEAKYEEPKSLIDMFGFQSVLGEGFKLEI